MTRWRQRMGKKRLRALIQESLAVAAKAKAQRLADLSRSCRRYHGSGEGPGSPVYSSKDSVGYRRYCSRSLAIGIPWPGLDVQKCGLLSSRSVGHSQKKA
jgi:hypothetical protein